MSETYKGWTINSVGDKPDSGTTPGCGTQEKTNWKNVIDKIGSPDGIPLPTRNSSTLILAFFDPTTAVPAFTGDDKWIKKDSRWFRHNWDGE